MPTSIITTDDLREFKMELIEDIKTLLSAQSNMRLKKYLKSSEIMDILQISSGTLQTLRDNGTLPFIKLGGIIFYESEENQKIMENNCNSK